MNKIKNEIETFIRRALSKVKLTNKYLSQKANHTIEKKVLDDDIETKQGIIANLKGTINKQNRQMDSSKKSMIALRNKYHIEKRQKAIYYEELLKLREENKKLIAKIIRDRKKYENKIIQKPKK